MASARRSDLRNVAIVAHVDHGKTTLVDAMLRQTNSFGSHEHMEERAMDSNDLEREKGITILAKNTAISYEGVHATDGPVTINVIDTPGHADFGGEVERGLSMVDGVVLLVDASEGPLPQTRFVLRKALESKLPVILLVNKTDRPDARIDEVVEESHDLLLGLASDLHDDVPDLDVDALLDVPVVYASGRNGAASWNKPENGTLPDNDDLEPLFDAILKHVPAPEYDDEAPLQAWVTNLDASPFLGRIALLRVFSGTHQEGPDRRLGAPRRLAHERAHHRAAEDPRARPLPGRERQRRRHRRHRRHRGHHDRRDDRRPRRHPPAARDHGRRSRDLDDDRHQHHARSSARSRATSSPPAWSRTASTASWSATSRSRSSTSGARTHGRCRAAASWPSPSSSRTCAARASSSRSASRRSSPSKVDGKLHEPFEHLTIDAPEEYLGAITQLLAARKGRMETMTNHGTGWVRMEFIVPSRGLIGFRTEFLTITRGTGIANAISHGYEPWAGAIVTRVNGSIVADRAGVVTPFAMIALQERMSFFVEPTQEVYEGMVVGENSRADDMDVNITKEKQLTNMRQSTSDAFERMTPSRKLTLEECLEFAREDECVEVTPEVVRIRKVDPRPDRARPHRSRGMKKQDA